VISLKNILLTIFAVVLLIVGSALLLYPTFCTWRSDRALQQIVQTYYEETAPMSQEEIDDHFRRAYEHNEFLRDISLMSGLLIGEGALIPYDYDEILNVGGVMARVEVPSVGVDLPVFHGSYPEVLARGVGHLEGTAFPTGGINTHAVLTAHSGMPNARFFTNLEQLAEGDIFYVSVLNRRLAYQVDQITVVLPSEIDALRIVPGADHVTLVTCTPYTINTHRLLVRGRRIAYPYTPLIPQAPAIREEPNKTAPIQTGIFVLMVVLITGFEIIKLRQKGRKKLIICSIR